jgi:hypothetical protein
MVREGVDTDDSVSLAPRISPAMEPFADTGCKAQARSPTSRVLGSGMLLFANHDVSCVHKYQRPEQN